jgi:hypothetical protein
MSNEPEDHRGITLHQFAIATEHYAWAARELYRQRPNLPRDEYEKLYGIIEHARNDCERLRRDLENFKPWKPQRNRYYSLVPGTTTVLLP